MRKIKSLLAVMLTLVMVATLAPINSVGAAGTSADGTFVTTDLIKST